MKKLLLLLFTQFLFGQNVNNQSDLSEFTEIIPPSPTTSQMMMLEHLPVDNYTGQPDISIDLGNYSDASLTIPLRLSYSTLGNKIDNISGWVGTGWALNSEMVISRTVVDIPDERMIDDDPINRTIGVLHNNYTGIESNAYSTTSNTYQSFLWNSSGIGTGNGTEGSFDKEYDLYNINILNKSASFIIKKNGNKLEVNFLRNENNFKVILSYDNITYNIQSFTVLDTSGNKYVMDVKEESNDITSQGILKQGRPGVEQPNLTSSNIVTYISAWKCSKITDYTNKEIASIQYLDVSESYTLPKTLTENEIISGDMSLVYGIDSPSENHAHVQYNKTEALPRKNWRSQSLTLQSKKMKSIILSNGTNINFQLKSGIHPEYNNSSKLLESITIKDKSSNVNKFNFIYGMSSKFGSSYKRVYLEMVSKTFNGNLESQDTNISYNGYLEVEPDSGRSDIWGYYKEEDPSLYMGFLDDSTSVKLVNKNSILKGLIKSISYPNGGVREYAFESNSFDSFGYREATQEEFQKFNTNNWSIINSRLANSSSFYPESQTLILSGPTDFTLETFHKGFVDSGGSKNGLYSDSGDGTSSENIFLYEMVSGEKTLLGSYDFDENQISKKFNFTLEGGTYIIEFLPNMDSDAILEAKVLSRTYKSDFEREILGGGVRIKSIAIKDDQNIGNLKKVFHYNTVEENNLNVLSKTSGVVDGFFTNVREYQYNKDHYLSAYTIFFSGEGFPKCVEIFRLGYKTTTYLNSVQAALKSGSYVGYENVFVEEIPYPDNETELLVSQQINLAKGFKLFKYTTPEDFPTYNEQSLSYPFLPVVDKTYKQGLLKQSFVFDQNNRLLQKDSINYDFKEHLIGKSLFTYTVQSGNALTKYFHSYTDFTNNNIGRLPVDSGFCNLYFVFTNIIGPIIQYDFKQHYRNRVLRKHSETKEFFMIQKV